MSGEHSCALPQHSGLFRASSRHCGRGRKLPTRAGAINHKQLSGEIRFKSDRPSPIGVEQPTRSRRAGNVAWPNRLSVFRWLFQSRRQVATRLMCAFPVVLELPFLKTKLSTRLPKAYANSSRTSVRSSCCGAPPRNETRVRSIMSVNSPSESEADCSRRKTTRCSPKSS